MPNETAVTIAYGDGIGPEIMRAVLEVLREAGAGLQPEAIDIAGGIDAAAWESLRRTRVFLKAPFSTPQGGGFKSLNVTMRQALGLYANVRPCVAYDPFVETLHPGMNVVIIRENEEDLYSGIEYRTGAEETYALKLISRSGTAKVVRYAFEYARRHRRRKVACFTKDNILKMTDGLFHRVFDEIGAEYPELEKEHWLVDIGAAKLADSPEAFDVVVLPNLYGDILSNVAAQIAGSVGLAGTANIGDDCAMFEAIHGSAPRRAGQDLANPSGLLLAAVLMLVHIGRPEAAGRVHNAWLRTIEEGIHTYDIFTAGVSTRKVGTREFAQAVVARLGQKPCQLAPVVYAHGAPLPPAEPAAAVPASGVLAGVDMYIEWPSRDPAALAAKLQPVAAPFTLGPIWNRGAEVWPRGHGFCTDTFRCRFTGTPGALTATDMIVLAGRIAALGINIVLAGSLRHFDGVPGYSLAQGE